MHIRDSQNRSRIAAAESRHSLPSYFSDFTSTPRMLVGGLSVVIGSVSVVLAWVLWRMISLCTDLFTYPLMLQPPLVLSR